MLAGCGTRLRKTCKILDGNVDFCKVGCQVGHKRTDAYIA